MDSQCLSYLIDAVQGSSAPSGDLAAEKIALFRTYLYTEGTLFVTPHVIEECAKIRNEAIRTGINRIRAVRQGDLAVVRTSLRKGGKQNEYWCK